MKKSAKSDYTIELAKFRERINQIDSQLLRLLNQRFEIVLEIAKLKKQNKVKSFYAPHREHQIYARLFKENQGPMSNQAIQSIFREIMSASIALEKKLKVAYLGPEASFTHMAALSRFGSQMEYVPLPSIADVFIEVAKKWADYGVVPIENSTEGVINHTLDMFMSLSSAAELQICSEITMEIRHHLLSNGELKCIKKVYSRDTALAQCRQWLQNNLPTAELIPVSSTTRGVQLAKKDKTAAAISSELAASLYGVKILAYGIEDIPGNVTRFLVIGRTVSEKSGNDKTSIMFSLKDRVGALYDALKPFQKYNINLTKIESRPSRRRAWEYIFFVDFNGYKDDDNVVKALKEVSDQCVYLKILGSYPASKIRAD
ncbi:MAG: prephenate dehydratase [bacterium]|nr:prephenate dehydratase [bacterium]